MTVTREDLNPCTVRLNVVCEPEQVKQSFDRALKKLAKNIRIPGFRPGHAPKHMVEQLVPKDQLFEEAADILVNATLKKAIDAEQLAPDTSTAPSVEIKKLDQETSEAEYALKVPLPPQITLGKYKGLPNELEEVSVTAEEVDFQIEEMRKRRSTREAITDRGVAEGDVVVVSIKADGDAEARAFMVINGKSFPELDEAVAGMQVEELKHLELPFPENFQDKDWAGTTKTVTLSLTSINSVKLPALDDEFAKSLSTEGVDDLKERVTIGLTRSKQIVAFEVATDKLLTLVQDASEIHVSDNMWESLADRRIRETAQEQGEKGKSLEQYAAEQGLTIEQFVEAWRERAQFEIRRALVIQRIFAAENLGLANEDLNQELFEMANEYQVEPAEMVKMLQENKALDELQFRAIQRKVRQFLLDNAVVASAPVDAPADAE